jgi:membrane-bound lytic murein transglycosylase B
VSTRHPRYPLPRRLHFAAFATLAALAAGPAHALDTQREDVAAFVARMGANQGFDAAELTALLARVESRPAIIESISRPAEKTLTWQEYRARFVTARRIARGIEVAGAQAAALAQAAAAGVPAEYLLAITGVETFYGEITGKYRVIDALATLAFDYPPRSRFFREQLEQYLLMAREESLDALAPLGSYAGAMGIPQFMPGSFRTFAVDGDGDGRRDLWGDWSDVFASVSNYLLRNGWRPGEPVMARADVSGARLDGLPDDRLALSETVQSLRDRGVLFETSLPPGAPAVLIPLDAAEAVEYRVGFSNYQAITRYNRSALYASAVNDLAEALATATVGEAVDAAGATPAISAAPAASAVDEAPATPAIDATGSVDAAKPVEAAPGPAPNFSFESISSTPSTPK